MRSGVPGSSFRGASTLTRVDPSRTVHSFTASRGSIISEDDTVEESGFEGAADGLVFVDSLVFHSAVSPFPPLHIELPTISGAEDKDQSRDDDKDQIRVGKRTMIAADEVLPEEDEPPERITDVPLAMMRLQSLPGLPQRDSITADSIDLSGLRF